MWLMLIFKDVAGNYALESSLPNELWEQYEPELMAMLESLKLGTGSLTESKAIVLARDAFTVSFDSVRASFDYQDGSWSVRFYTAEANGGDQIIQINAESETGSSVYGKYFLTQRLRSSAIFPSF